MQLLDTKKDKRTAKMDEHEIYGKNDNLLLSWTRNRELMKKEIKG